MIKYADHIDLLARLADGYIARKPDTAFSEAADYAYSLLTAIDHKLSLQNYQVVLNPTKTDVKIERDLAQSLDRLFENYSVFAGVTHPAEDVICSALSLDFNQSSIELGILLSDLKYPHTAELIRCIGRLPLHIIGVWGLRAMEKALLSLHMEVRDAAIDGLEQLGWSTNMAIEILRSHHDPDPTTAAWIKTIIEEYEASK